MKNAVSRMSVFLSVLMHCTLGLLFSIAAISLILGTSEVSSDLKLTWISPGNTYRVCQFVPNLDLKPQFNFNTKQIFLYLVLKEKDRSEMVWHTIVKNGGKYKFEEPIKSNSVFSTTKGNNTFEFELRGNIFPFVGMMKTVSYGKINYTEKKK